MKCEKCGADVDPITQVCDICGFPYRGEREEVVEEPSGQSVKKIYFDRQPLEADDWEADLSSLPTESEDDDDWAASFDRATGQDPLDKLSEPVTTETEPAAKSQEVEEDWEAQFDQAPAPKESKPAEKRSVKKSVLTHSPLEEAPAQQEDSDELKRVLQTIFTTAQQEAKQPEATPEPPKAQENPSVEPPPAAPAPQKQHVETPPPIVEPKAPAIPESAPQPPAAPAPPPLPDPPKMKAPEKAEQADDWQMHSSDTPEAEEAFTKPKAGISKPEPAWSDKPKAVLSAKKSAKNTSAKKPTQLPLSLPKSGNARQEDIVEIMVVAAGFLRRAVAGFIDHAVALSLMLLFVSLAIGVYGSDQLPDLRQGGLGYLFALPADYPIMLVPYAAVYFFFFGFLSIFFVSTIGRTPGDLLLDLRVIQTDGERVSGLRSIVRLFGYALSVAPFLLGLLWIAVDSRKQGLHDKLAQTLVIRATAKEES